MIVISINPTNPTASAVPTNKCNRIGQQQQIGQVVYTCVKSGKKLAWDKGSKILPSKIELVKSEIPKNYVHQNQEFEFKVTLLSNYSIKTIQGSLSIPARNSRIEFKGSLFDLSKNTGSWSFRIAIPSNFIAGENMVQITATDVKGFTKTFDLQTVDVRLAIPDVPQVAPTPTPSQTPSNSTQLNKPTVVTPAPLEPTDFNNLVDRATGVPYWAWKKTANAFSASSAKIVNVTKFVGPSSNLTGFVDQSAFNAIGTLFSNYKQVDKIIEILYEYSDRDWAQSEFSKFALHPNGNEAINNCQTISTCWGGMAEIDNKGLGIILWGIPNDAHNKIGMENGTKSAHEYLHTIQTTSFIGGPYESESYCCIKRELPTWFVEGQAQLMGSASIFVDDYNMYVKDRLDTLSELNNKDIYTEDWFKEYIDLKNPDKWYSAYPGWRQYDVGSIVVEILVAISGPGKTMDLVSRVGQGEKFENAFQDIYGIQWIDALPKISKAAYLMLQNGGYLSK